MKVLVITATIGQGHNAVARSIANGLSARGVDCEVLDMYQVILARRCKKLYRAATWPRLNRFRPCMFARLAKNITI